MSGTGAQVILDPASDAARGARGVAATTHAQNTVIRDANLISNALDPVYTKGPPSLVAPMALNFMVPGSLDPRIAFTRASTGTYFDSGGVLRTAAVNAPRWDYDPVSLQLRGLLIEEARTNLMLYSSGSGAAWNAFSSGGPSAPVVTANNVVAPDGTTTGTRLVYPAVSGAGALSLIYQVISTAVAPYSFSVWLRGNTGGEQIYINVNLGAGTNPSSSPRLTLTTNWQCFTLTTPALTAAGWTFDIGTDLRDGAQTGTPAQTIYAWGAQVETGSFAGSTSYIPTTTVAVTRAQDMATVPVMTPWFNAGAGTWLAEFITNMPASGSVRVIGGPLGGSGGGWTPVFVDGSFHAGTFDLANALLTANSTATGAIAKVASNTNGSTGKICLNGGALVAGSQVAMAGPGFGLLQYIVGANASNTTGYIRRVSYWPRTLSDTEMQSVTT